MDQNGFVDALRALQSEFAAAVERQLERFVEASNANAARYLRGNEKQAQVTGKLADALLKKLPIEEQELQAARALRDDVRAILDRLDTFEQRLESEGVLRHTEATMLAAKDDAAIAEIRAVGRRVDEISDVHDLSKIREEAAKRGPTSVPPPEAGKWARAMYEWRKMSPAGRFGFLVLILIAFSVLTHPVQVKLAKIFGEVAELASPAEKP